jgi:hypothetical protein
MALTALLAGLVAGCGEDQPNSPAQPDEANAEFIKKTADRLKEANSSMDPKKAAASAKPK